MERPSTNRHWKTKEGFLLKMSGMDYTHLKNCRKMLVRNSRTHLAIHQYLEEEIAYREWKKKNTEDDEPTDRFELIDFD